jgi:hypothetical protein
MKGIITGVMRRNLRELHALRSLTPKRLFAQHWKGIASGFLKLATTAYGGLAAMGIMQAEPEDKHQ